MSALAFQTLGATRVAVLAFSQSGQGGLTGTASVALEDDEDEESWTDWMVCACKYHLLFQAPALGFDLRTTFHCRQKQENRQKPFRHCD